MKTLVLQLDRSEDAGSIRDKVTWGKASRVLLVWPVNSTLLDRKIDLVTVKRICASQGSRLGIVCDIPDILAEAEGLQIPVFESVNRAMRKSWDRRNPRKTGKRMPTYVTEFPDIEKLRIDKYKEPEFWKIQENLQIPVFIAAVMAVFTLMVFLLPSAKVIIHPQGLFTEMPIEFRVENPDGRGTSPGVLSAAEKTISLSGETTITTTGSLMVPDEKAKGNLTITNLSSGDVTLPKGTIVQNPSNPSVRYQITREEVIPAEETFAEIGIEAIEPGIAGNTDARTVTSLEGKLGFNVEITNPEPVTGGTSKAYQAVSQADVDLAEANLHEDLKKQAELKFSETLSDQEIILPSSFQIKEVVDQTASPEVGQAGMLLKLKQSVDCTVLVINREELEKQSEMILIANQPAKGWNNSKNQKVAVKILSQNMDDQNNSVILKTTATQMIIPPLDLNSIASLIAGKSKTSASEIIHTVILNDNPAEIQTTPGWLPFLPLLSSRIQLEVD